MGRETRAVVGYAAVMAAVAVLGWEFMAADYAVAVEGQPAYRRTVPREARDAAAREHRGFRVGHALRLLPDAPAVFADQVRRRPWAPLLLLAVEAPLGWLMYRSVRRRRTPS